MALSDFTLYDQNGQRKYLTSAERKQFFEAIEPALSGSTDREKRTFVLMIYYSGCRISEALSVTYNQIDYAGGGVIFKTLKRKKLVHRLVPLPRPFMTKLDDVHRVKDFQGTDKGDDRIWEFGRTTGWTVVNRVMDKGKISGAQACPKGLRHSFAIEHKLLKTPETSIAKWMGHANTAMMAVYGEAVVEEERELAERLWKK